MNDVVRWLDIHGEWPYIISFVYYYFILFAFAVVFGFGSMLVACNIHRHHLFVSTHREKEKKKRREYREANNYKYTFNIYFICFQAAVIYVR